MSVKVPPKLKKGDLVAIVGTARAISPDECSFAINLLEKRGLQALLGKTIGLKHHQFAGTDAERAADFQAMLDNPRVKAIFCARGGYGTVRVLDRLQLDEFSKNPKWVAGFSDVTALHCHLQSVCKVASLHAPMPITFPKNTPEAVNSLFDILFGTFPNYRINSHPLNRNGNANGMLTGGNLSVLYSLLGSASDVDTSGKVLFLEDLDEYLYHIDRMMVAMKRAGKFDPINGLIVGGMTDMNDSTIAFGKNAYEIVAEHVDEFDFPVIFDFPAGHLNNNMALPMGFCIDALVNTKFCRLKLST